MNVSSNKLQFRSVKEAEDFLESTYLNKVIQFEQYAAHSTKLIAGKVDRIALDIATKSPGVVIIILNDGMRYEIEKDMFFSMVKLLN